MCTRSDVSTPIHVTIAADLAQAGTYLTITNAKIDMFRGSMRLAVDSKGSVEVAPQLSFKPRVSCCTELLPIHNHQAATCTFCGASVSALFVLSRLPEVHCLA